MSFVNEVGGGLDGLSQLRALMASTCGTGSFFTTVWGRPPERFRPSIVLADMRSEHPITP